MTGNQIEPPHGSTGLAIRQFVSKSTPATIIGTRVDSSQSVRLAQCIFSPRCKPWSLQRTIRVLSCAPLCLRPWSTVPTQWSTQGTQAGWPCTSGFHSLAFSTRSCLGTLWRSAGPAGRGEANLNDARFEYAERGPIPGYPQSKNPWQRSVRHPWDQSRRRDCVRLPRGARPDL